MEDLKSNQILSTIKGKYLCTEVKDKFDEVELSDTDIKIKMATRTGTGKYTNFSKHCKVVGDYPNSKIHVGEHFWTRHQVVDSAFDGKYISDSLRGKRVMALREENIIFVGDDLKTAKNYGDIPWILTQTLPTRKEKSGGIEVIKKFDDDKAKVINGHGRVEEGSIITWLTGGRIEYWENEKQFWAVRVDRITAVNGKPFGDFYELDLFEDFEYEVGGFTVRGKQAAMKKYNVAKLQKGEHLAKLNNPNLEHHGKVAIVRQSKKGVKYSDEVLAIID